ncbi:FAD/NAD(P)-binding domain-containing protein [Micrococcus cohnii]|uniref:FAD-dependent urate hydroxylase HpyO/Asp monooxygenase CreE-like FAD/NAD(P)-binding domain-containing protein n=1 Tax=Micrococcus cohnii TaxID=993416 RepID=A0A7W7GQL8_9MICC|nr:FAD/NAD(P)-binding protein [Micrococcus cohnii]MBB4736521.1 hypothetical protein [Micrococcus cohnii]
MSHESKTVRLVVVGAGPRAVMVLERLLAQLEAGEPTAPGRRLEVHVVDPYPAGPGRVWRTDQSELYLMNTPSFFPTASAADNPGLHPSTAALSFDQWRRVNPERSLKVGRNQYPSRMVYGRYLTDLFEQVRHALEARPEVGAVMTHRAEATALEPLPGGGVRVRLRPADGREEAGRTAVSVPDLLEADAAVLALGHQKAALSSAQGRFASAASASPALHYQGPQIPSDVDWRVVPAGAEVLVRGMGLNAFDLMAQLTQGRGGAFHRVAGATPGRALRYEPSGREPVLHLMSRRGVPYLPKAELMSFVPHGTSLSYLSDRAVDGLIAEHGLLDFDAHLWPLLHRDVVRHYYATMARTQPEFLGGPVRARTFLSELVGLLEEAGRGAPVTSRHAEELLQEFAPGRRFLDIVAYADPYRDDVFDSAEQYHETVATLLEQACAEAVLGEDSPFMMAVGALHAGRLLVKQLVAQGHISQASRLRDVQGWFEPLVEGLSSGPPRWRVEQMLALHRAGLADWVGRAPAVQVVDDRFVAVSPQVADAHGQDPAAVTGTWLVEAMMPPNRVNAGTAPLMRQLLADGVAAVGTWEDEDGELRPSSGFDVTPRPHRLRGADGAVREDVYVIGLQLSGVQWGTAIAAEAGESASGRAASLGDADAIARDVVARLRG